MFTLTISCLTSSNLPWFMDLTFQVAMQYCSLQYQTLLSSPDIPNWASLHFGSATSFFLELLVVVLCFTPVAYWRPSELGDSSFDAISFRHFVQFIRSSQQVYWGVCRPLLQWIMFCRTPACLGWPHMAWLIASSSYASCFAMTSDLGRGTPAVEGDELYQKSRTAWRVTPQTK